MRNLTSTTSLISQTQLVQLAIPFTQCSLIGLDFVLCGFEYEQSLTCNNLIDIDD